MKHASTTAPSGPRSRSFAASLLLGAALTVALAGVRSIAEIVGPVFMALVITIALHPIRLRLERGRLPAWATSVPMLASAVLLLSVFAVALMDSVAQLQPRVVADSVGVLDVGGLSPTLTFLSLVVGPVGALLAVPFTLLTKSLLVEADPRGRWALPLLSGKPETEPPPVSEQAAPATLQPEGTPG